MKSNVCCFNEFNVTTLYHHKPIAFSNERCFVVDDSQSVQVDNSFSFSDFSYKDGDESCKNDSECKNKCGQCKNR